MNISNISMIFPGQGSQRSGMGSDFFETYDYVRTIYEEASDSISVDLKKICFEEDDRINLTEYTQPSILVTEFAMYQVLKKEYGLVPKYSAGHSLGEYSALTVQGVFSINDAIKIVHKRGKLMQEAVPEGVGAMSALILKDIEKTSFLEIVNKNEIEVANFNSTDQVVISGNKNAVEKAGEELVKSFPEMNVVSLTVSAPFHCKLMKNIELEFSQFIKSFSINTENSEKVLSNFTGSFHKKTEVIENLVKQISGSVKWIQNMNELKKTNTDILEVGPNKPLGKFFGTIGVEVPSVINLRSIKKLIKDPVG